MKQLLPKSIAVSGFTFHKTQAAALGDCLEYSPEAKNLYTNSVKITLLGFNFYFYSAVMANEAPTPLVVSTGCDGSWSQVLITNMSSHFLPGDACEISILDIAD